MQTRSGEREIVEAAKPTLKRDLTVSVMAVWYWGRRTVAFQREVIGCTRLDLSERHDIPYVRLWVMGCVRIQLLVNDFGQDNAVYE
jgi:hypothetical protein